MPRSSYVGSAMLAGLLLTGLPFLGTSSATACPAWTDTSGDATTQGVDDPLGVVYDPNLDIVSTSLTTTADTIVAVIGVKTLSADASDFGDEFHVQFTVNGVPMQLFADRGFSRNGVKVPLGFGGGFYNVDTGDIAATSTPPVYDRAKNTVTITGKVSELKAAAGVEVAGKPATGLFAETWDYAEPPGGMGGFTVFLYDEAPAPSGAAFTVAAPCGDSTAPASTPPPATPPPTPGTTPPGPAAPAGYPATGCDTVGDDAGDAHVLNGNVPTDGDLDITGLALQATATDVKAFVRIKALAAKPASAPGHTFSVNFTAAAKPVRLVTTAYDPAQLATAEDAVASGTATAPARYAPLTYVSVSGGYVATGIKATYDLAHSMVILSVPRADLDKAVPFADGSEISAVTVRSATASPFAGGFYVDSTAPSNAAAGTAKWRVGDNACFGPAPGILANAGVKSVQFSDAAKVAAKLTDAAGKPLAGRSVTFAIGTVTATASTGPDGVARAALNPRVTAGTYSLVTSFAGDTAAAKVELATPFAVTLEATRIALSYSKSGAKRTVVAKLRDDDGAVLVGQTVDWYVNGKKVGSSRTNAAGVAQLTTAKPAQTVTAQFAGVPVKYAASKAATKV